MKPTRLELRNFMSYREAVIDFSEIEIAAIVGPNGAGKSSILQAITYALWGQVRTSSHNDVVRRGTGMCAVMLSFAANNSEYTIIRRRHLSGKGSSDLEFSVVTPSEKFIPLTKATMKETQREINRVLGMSYDAFSSSALLQQGDASRFSNARPGERKELLAEMLNLSFLQRLEAIARAKLKEIKAEFTSVQSLLEDREATLDGLSCKSTHEIAAVLADALARFGELEREIGRVEVSLQGNREQLESLGVLNTDLSGKQDLLESYATRLETLRAELERLTDQGEVAQALCDKGEEITAAKEVLDQLKVEADQLSEAAIEHSRLEALSSSLSTDLESEAEQVLELEQLTDELGELREWLETLQGREEEEAVELESARAEYTAASNNRVALGARLDGLRARREKLSGPESACPTCNTQLEDKDQILADLDSEIERVESELADAKNEERLTLSAVMATDKELEEIRRGISGCEGNIVSTSGDIRSVSAGINSLRKSIASAQVAKGELDELGFDMSRMVEVKSLIAASDAGKQHERLLAAQARLAEIDGETQEKEAAIAKGIRMKQDLEGEVAGLEKIIGSLPGKDLLETEIGRLEGALGELGHRRDAANREIASIEEAKDRLETLVADIEEYKSKLGLLEENRSVCDCLVRACSKTGAQALVIEAAIPQLEEDANALLKVMAHNMEIALNSQRQTQKGDSVETLEVVVFSNGHVAPIESLSGGERFRADLAIRLAIGRMISRRSSTAIEMLAVDEGFGSQDSDGQEAVVEVISSLQGLFGLILVISHVGAVAEAVGIVGNTITVSKAGNSSTLEVT